MVMLSALRDAVHCLPLANALALAVPARRIPVLSAHCRLLPVAGPPAIDDFVIFHRRRGLGGLKAFLDVRRAMAGRHFDLLIGLQVYFKAGVITAMTSADVKLGFDRARARDAQWLFTNRRIPARGQRHVQDQYLEFLEYLGVDPEPLAWDIRLSEEERAAQTAFFTELDRPACAVVLGTSKLEKNWNAEGYARVLEQLESEHGLRPVIIGGPSPVERRIADEVIASTGASVVDALGDDVRKLVWILEGSALLISPDTGPLHISRALETPVVGLYGYTNPKRLGPYRAFEDLIVDGYAEYPGEQYPVTSTYREGMQRITVDAVLEKVSLAMERYVRV